ncbi:MAG: hypothetical protein ACRERC_22040 [Candidatus Binatia bacterium]
MIVRAGGGMLFSSCRFFIALAVAMMSGLAPSVDAFPIVAGGTGAESAQEVVVDANGNVYLAGSFEGTLTIGDKTVTSTPTDRKDIYVAKFDKLGSVLWLRAAGGPLDDIVGGMDLDPDTNTIFLGGSFCSGPAPLAWQNPTPLNPAGTCTVTQQSGDSGFFVFQQPPGCMTEKLASACSARFANGQTGGPQISPRREHYGNMGLAQDSGLPQCHTNRHRSNTLADIFVAAISGNGVWLWANSEGSGYPDFVTDVKVDAGSDKVWLSGFIGGSVIEPGQSSHVVYGCGFNGFHASFPTSAEFGSLFSRIGTWFGTRVFVDERGPSGRTRFSDQPLTSPARANQILAGIPPHPSLVAPTANGLYLVGFASEPQNGKTPPFEQVLWRSTNATTISNRATTAFTAPSGFDVDGDSNIFIVSPECEVQLLVESASGAQSQGKISVESTGGGAVECFDLAAADDVGAYVTGKLTPNGVTTFSFGDQDVEVEGGEHLFIARVAGSPNFAWDWVLVAGGDDDQRLRDDGSIAPDSAVGLALAVDDESDELVVAGSLSGVASFDDFTASAIADSQTDLVAAKASVFGAWLVDQGWTVGQPIEAPPGADDGMLPMFEPADGFYWSTADKQLFPIRQFGSGTVNWRKKGGALTDTIEVKGGADWPTDPRLQVIGAPVDIELSGPKSCSPIGARRFFTCQTDADCGSPGPGNSGPCLARNAKRCQATGASCTNDSSCGGTPCTVTAADYTYSRILHTTAGATVENKVFTASASGYSVVLYTSPAGLPESLDVIRTTLVESVPRESCVIGSAVSNSTHRDPAGKNGWVVNPNAPYDGTWADAPPARTARAAHQRDKRLGPILPVNRDVPGDDEDDLVVVWYTQNSKGIAWPTTAIAYDCKWPESAAPIIIASELGSDGHCADVRGACVRDSDCSEGTCVRKPSIAGFVEPHIYEQADPARPGFNPNEEHALLAESHVNDGFAVFALRTDLNDDKGGVEVDLSEPYVLLKHRDSVTQEWKMTVYEVIEQDETYSFEFDALMRGAPGTVPKPYVAGDRLQAPYPLELLDPCGPVCAPSPEECATPGALACLRDEDPLCAGNAANQALFKDYRSDGNDGTGIGLWARAKGNVKVRFRYPMQSDFYVGNLDLDGNGIAGSAPGQCLPFAGRGDEQQEVEYSAVWGDGMNVLLVGETLIDPKRGLPEIQGQAAVEVAFETTNPEAAVPQNELASLVRIIDPVAERSVKLADFGMDSLPTDIGTSTFGGLREIRTGKDGAVKLSPGLAARMRYRSNATPKELVMIGEPLPKKDDPGGLGDPMLSPNIMTELERRELLTLSADSDWPRAVNALYHRTRNPNGVDRDGDGTADQTLEVGLAGTGDFVGAGPERNSPDKVLTAGLADSEGFVTLAFNNRPGLQGNPVRLQVIRIGCNPAGGGPYQGQVYSTPSALLFDEQITVRHNGDFGGDPSKLHFEWYSALKEQDCASIPVPPLGETVGPPWRMFDEGPGVVSTTIGGPGVATLADTCVMVRYTGYNVCENATIPSQWAGAPLGTEQARNPKSQLVPGWLTRVTDGLTPFDQRTNAFREGRVDTYVSALVQLGKPFEGDVALNGDKENLDNIGLIEGYGTVLRRGVDLSLDAGLSIPAVNSRLLDVAARTADFYMLLGNEAFSDALDPTIFFDDASGLGPLEPSRFAFQGQFDSLLDEELALLRGLDFFDPGNARPKYNRVSWNFINDSEGQLAYQQNYNITDLDTSGRIDEDDARILYPQGHGDAWGHYLTAAKQYYSLLRHQNFEWIPRSDSVLVAGAEVLVDFRDERRFAAAAAARARAGVRILDLTYRQRWVDDPTGQYQGYTDTEDEECLKTCDGDECDDCNDRGFGVFEWGQRAGQGAYIDWVVANAILPPRSTKPPGIQKIDRTTVPELNELVGQSMEVQQQLDMVDAGLNPLGLPKNVVPFDINPSEVDFANPQATGTHYEQVALRARKAVDNAKVVYDYASEIGNRLRGNQDEAADFAISVAGEERGFNTRLLEIFGSPYKEDIGPAGTYPTGYTGPDFVNHDISDPSEITGIDHGELTAGMKTIEIAKPLPVPVFEPCTDRNDGTCQFDPGSKLAFNEDGTVKTEPRALSLSVSEAGFGRVKLESWSEREFPGELQMARSELLQTYAKLLTKLKDYTKLIGDIECTLGTIRAQNKFADEQLRILRADVGTQMGFNTAIRGARLAEHALRTASKTSKNIGDATAEALPTSVGLSVDATSAARGAIQLSHTVINASLDKAADIANLSQLAFEQAADIAKLSTSLQLQGLESNNKIFNLLGDLGEKIRREPALRLEAYQLAEAMRQAQAKLRATEARGIQELDRLVAYRKTAAGTTSDARYRDMTFRVFRNDALQKYQAQFDLAVYYVYLAAGAYDYETSITSDSPNSGREFLSSIVRQRTIGRSGIVQPGDKSDRGLLGLLDSMDATFVDAKARLGLNNPEEERTRFSLREHLFRISSDNDAKWRQRLAKHRVGDLRDVPEYRRFAIPERGGVTPGIVIPMPTTITSGLNFFGWPLSGGDASYSSARLATKVRSVGVWLRNYPSDALTMTPNVFLIPTGSDVIRSEPADIVNETDGATREWEVLDQSISPPALGAPGSKDVSDRTWSPLLDTVGGLGRVRRYTNFRSHVDRGSVSQGETSSSRAIGRSVWNTKWMLFIPSTDLLADPEEALDVLIYGKRMPGGSVVDPNGVERDGNGIDDIFIFFQTYSYAGE